MDVKAALEESRKVRNEHLNVELAEKIAADQDKKAVQHLIDFLTDKKHQNNAIKILYEIAGIKPELISPHAKRFIQLLESKNNRLVWGSMTALNNCSISNFALIFENLPTIIKTMEKGTVITNDQGFEILLKLTDLYPEINLLIFEFLKKAPENQFPMYLEKSVSKLKSSEYKKLTSIAEDKLQNIQKESRKKRILKLLKKIG